MVSLRTRRSKVIHEEVEPEFELEEQDDGLNFDLDGLNIPNDMPTDNQDDDSNDPVTAALRFKPTKHQIAAKLRFYKHFPSKWLPALSFDQPQANLIAGKSEIFLADYMPGISEENFIAWLGEPDFWAWFLCEDDIEIKFYQSRSNAISYLLSILQYDDWNQEKDKPDTGIIGLKIRVSQMILNRESKIQVNKSTVNNTQNVANFNSGSGKIPKKYLSKSTDELQRQIKALREGS